MKTYLSQELEHASFCLLRGLMGVQGSNSKSPLKPSRLRLELICHVGEYDFAELIVSLQIPASVLPRCLLE
jgi:hypothetical protein